MTSNYKVICPGCFGVGDYKKIYCEECRARGHRKYDYHIRGSRKGKFEFVFRLGMELIDLICIILAWLLIGLGMVWEFPSRVKQVGEKYYRKIRELREAG